MASQAYPSKYFSPPPLRFLTSRRGAAWLSLWLAKHIAPDILPPRPGVRAFQFAAPGGHPACSRHHRERLLRGIVAVHRGDVDDFLVAHEAVAGVGDDRLRVGRASVHELGDRGGGELSVV